MFFDRQDVTVKDSLVVRFRARRLAAIDMYGLNGHLWRRRLILAEFALGFAGCVAIGAASIHHGGLVSLLLGLWLCGIGLNYCVLTAHAAVLSLPGRLDAELSGIDKRSEIAFYSRAQLLIVVPLALLLLSLFER
jgi:hypothetical protein